MTLHTSRPFSPLPSTIVLAMLALVLPTGLAGADQIVNLVAAPFAKTVTLPSGATLSVPMWGFGRDQNGDCTIDPGEEPTVPGPRIAVPAGEPRLTINLRNCLATPASIVIPGYPEAIADSQRNPDGRIRSLATEAAANGGSATYTFLVRPGTFLYHGGSHPAVQVQMGLYGSVTADAVAPGPTVPAEAYPGVPYVSESLLLFSEIDVALHQALGDADPANDPTSTIDYKPSVFLVNGESYRPGLGKIQAGTAGASTLVRLINAGLTSHVIVIDGATMSLVAEDGNPYADPRPQASALLPAGKTHDAIWTPAAGGDYAIYDRTLRLEADVEPNGGMLATLQVNGAPQDGASDPAAIRAEPDPQFATLEDTPLSMTAAAGVLANDAGPQGLTARLDTPPRNGSLVLNPDGSFVYVPSANYFGTDTFSYRAAAASGETSVPAQVTISVASVDDPPLALPLTLSAEEGVDKPITLTAIDPDGDPITIRVTQLPAPAAGTLNVAADTIVPGGTVVFRPLSSSAPARFTFVASDGRQTSAAAAVSITINPVPTAADNRQPLTLRVVGVDARSKAEQPVTHYRWTLEEDATYDPQPGVMDPNTVSVSFHRSYMPVVQSGDEATTPRLEAGKRYFVSVLPSDGSFSNGGAPVAPGATEATVYVNAAPLPTAQVRVRVFHDNLPLNGQYDTLEEPLVGFHVYLDDAGGRYGMSGGQMMQDAFGNPLGTTYRPCTTMGGCDSHEVATRGEGFLLTDSDGYATFENLPPGKYTAKVIPPPGQDWQQTTTIEGTKGIDAWVKANEPTFFTEFGPAGPHVEFGLVRPTRDDAALDGSRTISGRVTTMHMSRPPDYRMFSAGPFDYTTPWVGLNIGTTGRAIYAQPTGEDGAFSIPNVPDGSYTLVVFDSALDIIVASKLVNVSGASVTLGEVPVFPWFTRLYHYVFEDHNRNGQREAGEPGIPEMAVNTRWRDGSVYQSSATDGAGFVPFEETFPFFAWQVAEVDYARLRATGVTVVVDNGGNVTTDGTWPQAVGADSDSRILAPQPQGENGGQSFRTETGPVLLQAFQGFIGQTNVFLWGKAPYDLPGSHPADVDVAPFDDPEDDVPFPGVGDTDGNGNGRFDPDQFNGGISGIVHYSTTRAENLARWGAAEPWEPGIPGVRVQLWDAGGTHLLNEVQTDSWDSNPPAGCQGTPFVFLGQPRDCYDGLRNFNQVRPGVFDGGYAFYTMLQSPAAGHEYDLPLDQRTVQKPLPAGQYQVKVIVPEGYRLVKEEDKNVDFGDEYIPAQFYLSGYPLADAGGGDGAPPPEGAVAEPLAAPFCVGTPHVVPAELALFPGVPGAYADVALPLCDTKLVTLRDGQNGAANFFLFTEAPVAGHIVGFVLDDLANEFDQNSPQFGEKWAPPFLPVSIRDWTGREISRTYTDRYGVYNALVPSTFTAASPIPSGMSPNMLTACINSPLRADGIADPFYNKQYTQFCYTLQYMPGTTTYLDTPVLPTGAFTGPNQVTLDAELPDKTPVIKQVNGPDGIGPYVVPQAGAAFAPTRTITIDAMGDTPVPNPAYDPNVEDSTTNRPTVTRDYGFGGFQGKVFVGSAELPAATVSWGAARITAEVPVGTPSGQLRVVRCLDPACIDTADSHLGVTLTVATLFGDYFQPPRTVASGGSIQAAIDAASPGDLILVAPGTYDELIVMDKPVRLQGWGARSTLINAVKTPAEKMQAWVERVSATVNQAGASYLLPPQAGITADPEAIAPVLGGAGAAITVLARNLPLFGASCPQIPRPFTPQAYGLWFDQGGGLTAKARVDGFGITGSDQAAGIEVNAFACNLRISNNHVYSNVGDFAGGIKIGHPGAEAELADQNAHNDYVVVANNHVSQNGTLDGNGGGAIAIGTGAYGYEVVDNFVAGNFSAGFGAGLTHLGLSDEGTIAGNTVVFNESFNQSLTRAGGGLFVGGRPPIAGGASPGAGDVSVSNNLVLGNSAAGGDGGGVALANLNPSGAPNRFRVGLYGNTIVNNVAGLAGGGISLENATNVHIINTTVADNDSLAVAGAAFTAVGGAVNEPFESSSQPAGIVGRGTTTARVVNSIVWRNRSFYFGYVADGVQNPYNQAGATYGLIPAATPYRNFGTFGGASLSVSSSIVSEAGDVSLGVLNTTDDPQFLAAYSNGNARQTIVAPELTTAIQVPAAFDEGGNFIRPMFGPLTLARQDGSRYRDYHVAAGRAGQPLFNQQVPGIAGIYVNRAQVPQGLRMDFEGDGRMTTGVAPTIGADQVGLPRLTIGDASVLEGNSGASPYTELVFTIGLSRPADAPVTVRYATANGTASGAASANCPGLAGCDYVSIPAALNQTLTIPAGQTTATVVVLVKGDVRAEAAETFFLNLRTPTNALLADAQAVGRILDDESAPAVVAARVAPVARQR